MAVRCTNCGARHLTGPAPTCHECTGPRQFYAVASYMTASGNHGSSGFYVTAPDMDAALVLAQAKAAARGRSRIHVHLTTRS